MSFNQQQLNRLYQYAMTLASQPADAYDLLHGSLESYLRKAEKSTVIRNPEAYIRTLIRNRFIDQYRYQQRWQFTSEDNTAEEFPASIDLSLDSLEDVHIQRDQLERIWRKLSPQDRDILYHWALLGFTTQETSERLNMPKGTLLSRIRRLRQRFQNHTDQQGDQHEQH
ncbi:MAG: hypothetical protein CL693_11010 [Cellvibrionaceae bacterium]|nr:hypothetical protein [Cellvibrionaceae bacterium]|tara:strand:+ start:67418 stop:67924 length:507 start_codon:yes stop_codon:yes gene_type:complete